MNADKPRILIMGGTGFVGRELGRSLVANGYSVTILSRRPETVAGQLPFPCQILPWSGGELPQEAVDGCAAVVNLVGEGIADKPWTKARRAAIQNSRTQSVSALVRALAAAQRKPRVVIQASAVGFYGDRGDEVLDEHSKSGSGFLASTCIGWERSLDPIEGLGVRLVVLRIGIVLGLTGGALLEILSIYSKGLGAVLGSGKQWVSWIHVDDLVSMVKAAIADEGWHGTYNATAPVPCRQGELSVQVAKAGRYKLLPAVPAFAVRVAMGGRAELVLSSARVLPTAALKLGFKFRFQSIDEACAILLGDAVETNLRRLVLRQWCPVPPDHVWPFFSNAENLEQLTPPWLSFKISSVSTAQVGEGTIIKYKLRLRGIPMSWDSVITHWQPGQGFVDEQIRGPYSTWHHTHLFEPLAGGTLITDSVQYRLPLSPFGELAAGQLVASDVQQIFNYRRQIIGAMKASDFLRVDGQY